MTAPRHAHTDICPNEIPIASRLTAWPDASSPAVPCLFVPRGAPRQRPFPTLLGLRWPLANLNKGAGGICSSPFHPRGRGDSRYSPRKTLWAVTGNRSRKRQPPGGVAAPRGPLSV